MVMPSHQKVRAAHGIDAWPSHVRQHVGSNRNNTSGSAQWLRRDSVNQSKGTEPDAHGVLESCTAFASTLQGYSEAPFLALLSRLDRHAA